MATRKFYIWHEQNRNPEAEDGFGWLVGERPPQEMAYTGVVIYDLANREWGLLEDMETTPTVTHWDGNNMQYHPLPDWWEEEIIEVEEQAICIDRWDGNNICTGGSFDHAHVYRSIDNRYVLVLSSQWAGSRDKAAILEQDEFLSYMEYINRAEEAKEIVERFSGISGDTTVPEKIADAQSRVKSSRTEIKCLEVER
jgi:hypothetical protein